MAGFADQAICHEAEMASRAIQNAAAQFERPSVLYRPALTVDGNRYCALYGENLQVGCSGFGDSPAAALWDFDVNWGRALKGGPHE